MKARVILLALALALVAAPSAHAARDLYVSFGDSYAVGYQATGQGAGKTTNNGFADQLVPLARQRGYKGLKLVNFGCGGETTASFMKRTTACRGLAPGGEKYTGKTQLRAGEEFLKKNRDRIAFVTIILGGNDVTRCASAPDAVKCVLAASTGLRKNMAAISRRLRKAVGDDVPMIGGTYPNVILGLWTSGKEADQNLARLSSFAFQTIINPALKKAYGDSDIDFVDVTGATGAYGSLDQTTTVEGYGTLPVPVATICEISYYCQYRDIHLRTDGYRQMAELFVRELPRPSRRRR